MTWLNLPGSVPLSRSTPGVISVQVLWKSVQLFLYNPADEPTNKQTNEHGWKHKLSGGGKYGSRHDLYSVFSGEERADRKQCLSWWNNQTELCHYVSCSYTYCALHHSHTITFLAWSTAWHHLRRPISPTISAGCYWWYTVEIISSTYLVWYNGTVTLLHQIKWLSPYLLRYF